MKTLPVATWGKIALAVLAVVVAVFVFRKLMKTNKVVASLIGFVVLAILFFSWVYNRNEPAFLTPFVERVAPFFPSAKTNNSAPRR
ncbi:hypothetical protein [Oleiharenicola lentus]|uniref:hypothetical protein n=1 Tax=Oleiharenicola lentus TaxID=2508720 RepID=UPI003F660CFD